MEENKEDQQFIAQFVSIDENEAGPQIYLPANTTTEQLQILLNEILQNVIFLQLLLFNQLNYL